MPTALDLAIARRFRQLAAEQEPQEFLGVRVFGSRARGEAHEDSDLDLFVMTRSEDRHVRARLQDLAWEVAREFDFPYPVMPLVMSRDRFLDLVRRERLLAREIEEQGIPA